ncbi:hypothetical protein D3C78_1382070 [compost metagenome]
MLSRLPSQIGYMVCSVFIMICRCSSKLSSRSKKAILLLWVIRFIAFLSPKLNNRSTISCSIPSIAPLSTPSSTNAFISSSVTELCVLLILNSLTIQSVEILSSQTKGRTILLSRFIG